MRKYLPTNNPLQPSVIVSQYHNNSFWTNPASRGFPGGTSGKEPACQCWRCRFNPWVRKIPWRRAWQPTLVFLPGESPGAWWATIHGVAESQTWLKQFSTAYTITYKWILIKLEYLWKIYFRHIANCTTDAHFLSFTKHKKYKEEGV